MPAVRIQPRRSYVAHTPAELARLTKTGDHRRGWAVAAEMLPGRSPPVTRPWTGLGDRAEHDSPHPSDMLITIGAADAFDAEPDLHRVQAPTLVLGGSADQFTSEDIFRRTAAGIPNGRVVIFHGKGH